jgi:hypothetical protein
VSIDLIAAALILAFAAIVVLGHVLVIAAIYRIMREDRAGGRRASNAVTTANEGANCAASIAKLDEAIEPQHAHAFGARCFQDPLVPAKAGAPDCGPRRSERSLERSKTRRSPPTRVAPRVASPTPATCYARGCETFACVTA